MHKILVTGANGFVGKTVAKHFSHEQLFTHGHTSLSPFGVPYQFDLQNRDAVFDCIHRVQPEYVIHCAASIKRAEEDRDEIFSVNVTGTKNLLDALHEYPPQLFVYFSTGEVCGGHPSPLRENLSYFPISPYSESKKDAELLLKNSGITYVILRPLMIYGPGQRGRMFIPQLLAAARDGQPFPMTLGEPQRDFVYVDDIGRLCTRLVECGSTVCNDTYFVASGELISMADLADTLNHLLGNRITLQKGALSYRNTEIWEYSADASHLYNRTGWRATTLLRDGLRETVAGFF